MSPQLSAACATCPYCVATATYCPGFFAMGWSDVRIIETASPPLLALRRLALLADRLSSGDKSVDREKINALPIVSQSLPDAGDAFQEAWLSGARFGGRGVDGGVGDASMATEG